MKKSDGSFYLNRKCYQCARTHKGKRTKKERFFEYVEKKSFGCWEWSGGLDKAGYGRFGLENAKGIGAHRYSYALHYGSFKKSLFVLHECDNPKCVNPDHLFLGTHQDNMADMVKKGRQRALSGEDSPACKITEGIAINILNSQLSYNETAKKYGVSKSTVAAIKQRRTWKHLTET